MIIHTPAHNSFRSAVDSSFPQTRVRRNYFDLPGGTALWLAAGKVALAILPVVLLVNLWIGASYSRITTQIAAEEIALKKVDAANIALRSQKATILSPENVQVVAAEKLALLPATKRQIKRM